MAGVFDHLHIKRNTAGSSNELSFDVLDAARDGIGASKGKQPSVMISARESQGSYSGRPEEAALSTQKEIARRKRRRRVRAVVLRICVVVAVLGAMGTAAFSAWRYMMDTQAFEDRYDALVNRLVELDGKLSTVDTLMQDPVSADGGDSRAAAVPTMESARPVLESLRDDALDAKQYALNKQDEIALDQIAEASSARLDMITAALGAFAVSGKAQDLANSIDKVWSNVIAEDQDARQASADANKASTEDAIKASNESTKKVQDKMAATLADLETIQKDHPDVDLTAHIQYLKTRVQSLEYAQATGEALLAGDREKATKQNNRYNEADEEAAKLAVDLPLSTDKIVQDSFDSQISSYMGDYTAARNRAIAADALIRERLAQ